MVKKSATVAIIWVVLSLAAAIVIAYLGRMFVYNNGVDLSADLLANGNQSLVFVKLAQEVFPAFIAGLLLAAIIAASMSTADSQLLVAASSFSSDLYKPLVRKNASNKEMLWVSRIIVLVIAVIAYFIASSKGEAAQAIMDLIPKLDGNFTKAIELIIGSKGKLILTGVGKSGHIGAKIASTMASTGTPAFFVNPLDAFHGDLGMICTGDVVLAISNSGQTDELLRFIPLLKERNIPIISMSGNPESLLAKYSECHLDISVNKEACPLNLAPTSSTTATLAMGDAIACALMTVRNFQAKDFAQFHPGGSLGRRLLSRVKDYMTSENLPIVTRDSKICDTLLQISRTKMGIAVVVEDGRILGAVTDGDIRRTMQRDQDSFFQLTVKDLMNTNPKTIKEDAKLSEAESIMRKHNIKSLIVVNEENSLVGVIDAFSCL